MFRKIDYLAFFCLSFILALTACSGGNLSAGPGSTPVPTGTATVSWSAPLSRADGSAISIGEIGGYYLYYGTSSGSITHSVNVSGGSSSQYQVNSLAVGTYYFQVSAYDLQGIEGARSAVGSKTIN